MHKLCHGVWALFTGLFFLFASGCAENDSARQEQRALLIRLGALDLRAPFPERQRQIEALRTLSLEAPALRGVRERCVSAHAGLLKAERAQAAAREQLDGAGSGGLSHEQLTSIAKQVAEASRTLQEAEAALPGCEQSVRALSARVP